MAGKPPARTPAWVEALLTLWVIAVGLFYFGGYYIPVVGAWTWLGSLLYAGLVLLCALTLAFRYLHRSRPAVGPKPSEEDTRTKD